ncbi:hypothetical protein TTE2421 [Caldanaerobacter subterraneus subsp. tengcongensis MB4]|uniref:Uncharacterized protein n=1 Tax=Caldanaerobacter subterraneus subsp. tengcongensis (strain DSM 15242 / JCM 11007 / NBRC 100824 / MB4) TaxID=273068 RepID=Q8R7I6_CALS4|nr:hypothetical protein TTE2421 [Caldanaerobacter subterraneus subsp. tengcongensis MB4]
MGSFCCIGRTYISHKKIFLFLYFKRRNFSFYVEYNLIENKAKRNLKTKRDADGYNTKIRKRLNSLMSSFRR